VEPRTLRATLIGRFWYWFNEPVLMARAWYLLAVGFSISTAVNLIVLAVRLLV